MPVVWKFCLFIALSSLPLLSRDLPVNLLCTVAIAALILRTGYYYHNPGSAKFLILSFCSFIVIWVLFSNVAGETLYIVFPWGTQATEQTLLVALTAAIRWTLICQAGIFFLVTTAQNEIIDALISARVPHQFVLSLTIALNTMVFILETLPQINTALDSRNVPKTSVFEKIGRLRLIGVALLSESIVRIAFLKIAYHFEIVELERMYGQKEPLRIDGSAVGQNPEDERGAL